MFNPRPRERWFTAAALAIVLAALAVQLWTLDAQSIWFDEAMSWDAVRRDFAGMFGVLVADTHPPLHHVIHWAFLHAFGDTQFVLRLPAALSASATIALVAYLGERLGGSIAGLSAALLLALSPFFFYYAQEARMYSLLAFTATLTATAVLRYLWQPSPGRLAMTAVAATALLYSHIYGGALLCGIAAGTVPMVWRDRPRAVRLLLVAVIAVLAFMPWFVFSSLAQIQKITGQGFWLPPLSWQLIGEHVTRLLGGPLPGIVLAAAAIMGIVEHRADWRYLWFLLCWTLCSFAAGVVVSLLVTPIFYDRYFIGALPPLAILAGLGFSALMRRGGRALAAVLLLAACVTSLAAAVPLPPRHNWRAVVETLAAEATDNDCVLLVVWWAETAMQYYWREREGCFMPLRDPRAIDFAGRNPRRVFLVAAHGGDVWRTALETLAPRYRPIDERYFDGIRLFRLERLETNGQDTEPSALAP